MNIKPLKTKVLVKANITESKSEFGIILDAARSVKDTQTGTVHAVGPNVTEVEVDNIVVLDWSKATVVKINDVEMVMVDEKDLIAVLG